MDNNLQGFDPLLFLGITNLQGEEKDILSQELLYKMSRYIAVRIAELLQENDIKDIAGDPEKLFSIAKDKIPDSDNMIKLFMEDFRKEFNENLKQI